MDFSSIQLISRQARGKLVSGVKLSNENCYHYTNIENLQQSVLGGQQTPTQEGRVGHGKETPANGR